MNIRWGHDFINHFIWFIFIRNYVTCYIFVFESQFEHTSAVSTDARRKYKITWSYRYSCESLRCGQEPKSERGEYAALTDEQSVQAILKHPNACRHVTLSDMHSLHTHTKACTRLVDTPRVSQCYYIPHLPTFSYSVFYSRENATVWERVWDFPLICHKSLNSRKEARTIPSSRAVLYLHLSMLGFIEDPSFS